jgi:hypothetical protein
LQKNRFEIIFFLSNPQPTAKSHNHVEKMLPQPQQQQPNKTQTTTQNQKQTHIKPPKNSRAQKNLQQQLNKKNRNKGTTNPKQVCKFNKFFFHQTETCQSRIFLPSQENFKGTN